MNAHRDDAIDLLTLTRHHDRIRAGLAEMNETLAEDDEHHAGGRAFLHDSLRLLAGALNDYATSKNADRRLANWTFYTRLNIVADEQLQLRLAEPFATTICESSGADYDGADAEQERESR